jgi:hypothetical protein
MPAGSLPGERRGGRRSGTPNRATVAKAAEIAASGLTPLDFLIATMRDEQLDLAVRIDAAKAVAPYVHPKLSAVDLNAQQGQRMKIEIVRFGDLKAREGSG